MFLCYVTKKNPAHRIEFIRSCALSFADHIGHFHRIRDSEDHILNFEPKVLSNQG